MSTERHPNLNAAGLAADIYEAIELRIRGEARDVQHIILGSPRVSKMVTEFVNQLDEDIDHLVDMLHVKDVS